MLSYLIFSSQKWKVSSVSFCVFVMVEYRKLLSRNFWIRTSQALLWPSSEEK